MALSGLVRIDSNTTVKWLGQDSFNHTVLSNIQLTPTKTIFSLTAGPIDLTVTFLSPIEVGIASYEQTYILNPFLAQMDLVLQSLPLAYVALVVSSNDGQPHDVQVYLDMTGGMRVL